MVIGILQLCQQTQPGYATSVLKTAQGAFRISWRNASKRVIWENQRYVLSAARTFAFHSSSEGIHGDWLSNSQHSLTQHLLNWLVTEFLSSSYVVLDIWEFWTKYRRVDSPLLGWILLWAAEASSSNSGLVGSGHRGASHWQGPCLSPCSPLITPP